MLSLLFKPKRRKAVLALMKAAKEHGMSVEEYAKTLTPEQMAAYLPPAKGEREVKMPDVALWGLPPDGEVTAEAFIADARVAEAAAAARGGDWQPGAELLAALGTDWDRRAFAVRTLGAAAADDDTALKAWRAARPGDGDAAVVHADALVSLAWQIRSSARAKNVSQQQFEAFFRVLDEADAATQAAAELLPDDPTPWRTRLTVAMGRQYENDDFREVWAELVARDPLHRSGHDQALQYWCDKWFGSHEQMQAFAEEAAAKSPKLAALQLVAAHEAESDDASSWKHERVGLALDRLLPWLDGEGRDHPSNRSDRAYAAKALVAQGRCDEAVAQFKHLGVHADAHVWGYSGVPRQEFKKTRYLACYGATRP